MVTKCTRTGKKMKNALKSHLIRVKTLLDGCNEYFVYFITNKQFLIMTEMVNKA